MPATGVKPTPGAVLRALVPPIVLIVAVLGSILGGIATPTEAASVGAIGALLLAGLRLEPDRSGWPVWLAIAAVVALLVLTAFVDLRLGPSQSTPPKARHLAAMGLVASSPSAPSASCAPIERASCSVSPDHDHHLDLLHHHRHMIFSLVLRGSAAMPASRA